MESSQDTDTHGKVVIHRPIQPHLALVSTALWELLWDLRKGEETAGQET